MADTFSALKLLKALTTPWDKTKAFKLGLVDDKGVKLKSAKTSDEKNAMTPLDVIAFNLKRKLAHLPFGKTTFGTYAAALYLLKEDHNIPEDLLGHIMLEACNVDPSDDVNLLMEQTNSPVLLESGSYALATDYVLDSTGHNVALGTLIEFDFDKEESSNILGESIYKFKNPENGSFYHISGTDLLSLS